MTTKKILIVEDNASMRSVIKNLIQPFADEIYECDNGKAAIEAYDTQIPDWVLMDIKMKGVDGITASRMIKERHPDAKIVIVTSYDTAKYRDAAQQAGVRAYVSKENLMELVNILENIPSN